MGNLLTHQRYQEITAKELHDRFSWAHRALLAMAPGHLGIVIDYLAKVESIVGADALTRDLRVLHIAGTEELGLNIYLDVAGLPDVAYTSLTHSLKRHDDTHRYPTSRLDDDSSHNH